MFKCRSLPMCAHMQKLTLVIRAVLANVAWSTLGTPAGVDLPADWTRVTVWKEEPQTNSCGCNSSWHSWSWEDVCSPPKLAGLSGTYITFPIASGIKPICSFTNQAHLLGHDFLQCKEESKSSAYSSTLYSDLDLDEQATVLNLNSMVNPLSNL